MFVVLYFGGKFFGFEVVVFVGVFEYYIFEEVVIVVEVIYYCVDGDF